MAVLGQKNPKLDGLEVKSGGHGANDPVLTAYL